LPLYEYECAKDGTFEQIQKFSDPPLAACPTCGGPVEKLLSAPAIQFKGTGWYITDYARKGDGGAGQKKDQGSEKGASSSETSGKDKSASGGSAADSPAAKSSSSGSDSKR
jgi:putative FmdB family regulatory protein